MTTEYFSSSYVDARSLFLGMARNLNLEVSSYQNPEKGPSDGLLFTDVVVLGSIDASKRVVVISGTHGAEGYCGSAAQVGWLNSPEANELQPDVAVIMIHAINPYGFAWTRRVNEDNVDINRNYLDDYNGRQRNVGYDELSDFIIPRQSPGKGWSEANKILDDYLRVNGKDRYMTAVASGQYTHQSGLFYGGKEPSWSVSTLKEIVAKFVSGADRVCLIDIHSGLGPFGVGELRNGESIVSPGHKRVVSWFGIAANQNKSSSGNRSSRNDSAKYPTGGSILSGIASELAHLEVTKVVLEFGTIPLEEVMMTLRKEAWLHNYGDFDNPIAADIKKEFLRAFYPESIEWEQKIYNRSTEVINMAISGLAN